MQQRAIMVVALAVATVCTAGNVRAEVPELINYQGSLADSTGSPVTGTHDLTFTIYDDSTAGSVLWTETQTGVQITDGRFNVLLGSVTPLADSVFGAAETYLGMQVDADAELSPRSRFASTPYAHRVASVAGATAGELDGKIHVLNQDKDTVVTVGFDETGGGCILLYNPAASRQSAEAAGLPVLEMSQEGIVMFGATMSDTAMFFVPSGNIRAVGQIAVGSGSSAGTESTVFGFNNSATGDSSAVTGGHNNTASGHVSVISGGAHNVTVGIVTTIAGGAQDSAVGAFSAIGGGHLNITSDDYAVVAGGHTNSCAGIKATISGGEDNTTGGPHAVVSGGKTNTAAGSDCSVGGGQGNTATGVAARVGGGADNYADTAAVVCGGLSDSALGVQSFVGGGNLNQATGNNSVVAGGRFNYAGGVFATVPGGRADSALGDYAHAAGHRAVAIHRGTFVWADDDTLRFPSLAVNEFAARCRGGVRFITGIDSTGAATSGVGVAPGGGSWSMLSDRAAKENVEEVDTREVLRQLEQLPIRRWNYRTQDDGIRHMGPMAQDFARSFRLGEDDRYISTVDGLGVALAAIQGLAEENAELRRQLEALQQRIEQVETDGARVPSRERDAELSSSL